MRRTLIFILLLFWSSSALADNVKQARSAFEAGEAAFQENNYDLALEHFRQAFALKAHDVVRLNIALCLERLGRYAEASSEYQLAAESKSLDAETRSEATALAQSALSHTGELWVEGPQGSAVQLSGEQCSLPCRRQLDPGVHYITTQDGDSTSVIIVAGQSQVVRLLSNNKPQLSELSEPSKPSEPPRPRLQLEPQLQPSLAEHDSTLSAGPLTWIGAGLVATGSVGTIVFGLETQNLQSSYIEDPSVKTREDGLRTRTLTNVSIGVGVVGAALVLMDLLWLSHGDGTLASKQTARRTPGFTF